MSQTSEPEISMLPKKETGKETTEKTPETSEFNETDEENSNTTESKKVEPKIPEVKQVKSTLLTLQGQEYTPGNAEKLQAARGELAEAAASVGLPYEAQQSLEEEVRGNQEKDTVENKQVAGGKTSVSELEVAAKTEKDLEEAETKKAVADNLKGIVNDLAPYGIRNQSDLQMAMGCESPNDLIKTCREILAAASPYIPEGSKTHIGESLGNLDALKGIVVAAFELHKKDPDFKLTQLKIDPEAAITMMETEKALAAIQSKPDDSEKDLKMAA